MSHESPTKQTPQTGTQPATLRDETPAGVPLTSRTADAQSPGTAVCAIRPHPDAATNPQLFALPPDITDQHGTRWYWSAFFGAYRADLPGSGTWAWDQADLCGNAFEWAWSESRASDLARQVLLKLIWRWETTDTSTWPGYWWIWDKTTADLIEDVEDAVLELVALGELSLDPQAIAAGRDLDLADVCPSVRCWLPAYQAWAIQHAPKAVTE